MVDGAPYRTVQVTDIDLAAYLLYRSTVSDPQTGRRAPILLVHAFEYSRSEQLFWFADVEGVVEALTVEFAGSAEGLQLAALRNLRKVVRTVPPGWNPFADGAPRALRLR